MKKKISMFVFALALAVSTLCPSFSKAAEPVPMTATTPPGDGMSVSVDVQGMSGMVTIVCTSPVDGVGTLEVINTDTGLPVMNVQVGIWNGHYVQPCSFQIGRYSIHFHMNGMTTSSQFQILPKN